MVRNRIVCGITSQDARKKLLPVGDQLTMDKAIEMVVTHESTKQQLMTIQKDEAVETIKKRRLEKWEENRQSYPNQANKKQNNKSQAQGKGEEDTFDCSNCGHRHGKRACPAYSKQCLQCGKLNHFSKVCRSRRKTRTVHHVEDPEQQDELDSSFTVDIIADSKDQPNTAYANISMETGDVPRFKIDTGAQVNVIPYQVFRKMSKRPPPHTQ